MPGVTLQRNEGEGQDVQIRGTEPRLSNTTIDGEIVPGPDPEVRQVDLDTIPADLVGSVAINKTLSANQDGDAIGGSVDLRIKQPSSDRPTLMFEGTDGYTPIANGRKAFAIGSSADFGSALEKIRSRCSDTAMTIMAAPSTTSNRFPTSMQRELYLRQSLYPRVSL